MRLVYIAVAWVIGIGIARATPTVESQVWLAGVLCCLALAVINLRSRWVTLCVALVAVCAGGWRQSILPTASEVADRNGSVGTLVGVVIDEPKLRGDRVLLRIDASSLILAGRETPTSGHVLAETARRVQVNYGDRIRATGQLAAPPRYDNFSYADYLARQGIFSRMPNAAVSVVSGGHGSPIRAALIDLRRQVKRDIANALPEPQAGLLTGILTGDESGISPQLAEDFSRTGASHIIAISGFNLVILGGIVFRMAMALTGDNRLFASFCGVVVILAYAVFVGASAGVLRAALMCSLVFAADLLRRRRVYKVAPLSFAAIVLLSDPNTLYDLSFQLSFCAVMGLILFADGFSERLRRALTWLLPDRIALPLHGILAEPFAATLAVHVAVLPLTILYFGQVSLVALPVNLLIVPVQPILLALGLAGSALNLLAPQLGNPLLLADMPFLSWSIGVVRAFGELELAARAVNLHERVIQLFYALLAVYALLRGARPRLLQSMLTSFGPRRGMQWLTAALGIQLILLIAMLMSRGDGRLHVWLLDVGQSNAVLMQSPGGAHILIDGGRFPSRLLTSLGDRLPWHDRRIELLAITHPDERDIAALPDVLARYEVGIALTNGQPNRGETYLDVMRQLDERDTEIATVRAGNRIAFSDGLVIEVLHPQRQPREDANLHDNALVLRVVYGEVSFLLTSDLGRKAQETLVGSAIALESTVLQLPRNAMRGSLDADFLAQVAPKIALLQTDEPNYGAEPDHDVLNMLADIDLLRTDELGAIHISADGVDLHVHR